jgi:hypothetical protein
MTNQTVALGTVEADHSRQANDNVRMLRLLGRPGSPQRRKAWTLLGRKAIEAAVLYLVVAALAQNLWLALAVTVADLALRPVADRLAAWAWTHRWHRPSYHDGHAH